MGTNWLSGIVLGCFVLFVTCAAGAEAVSPPRNVKAERQDFQAARISWTPMGKNIRYRLYAAYDRKPLDFHQENDGRPVADPYQIWDAPRGKLRRFVFYVTAVDEKGEESKPSNHARVDLGPLPTLP